MRIAQQLGLSPATISRVLRRLKLNRIRDLEPRLPPHRYEHAAPGDLVHLDIKRLVRIQRPSHRVTGNRKDGVKGIGAEFLHIAIDDHSRLAFTAMYPDQTERSSTHFLAAATAWFHQLGIQTRRVLTDNGACYNAHRFRRACEQLGLKHRRTRPYTPRTNGKAERFIQTALREWAYARIYQNSDDRTASLSAWIHQYNWHRPHASLNQQPPISRAALDDHNLLTHHTSTTFRTMYWSIRRELWESRWIYIAPLAAAAVFLLGFLISLSRLPAMMRSLSALDPAHQREAIVTSMTWWRVCSC